MPAPISTAGADHTAEELHQMADECKDARQARRLRGVALVREGFFRCEVARALHATRRSVYAWVARYEAFGVAGLKDAPRSGRPRKLSASQRAEAAAWVETGTDPETGEAFRWRLSDLVATIRRRFGVEPSPASAHRLLKERSLSHISTRALHPKADPAAQQAFRETFAAQAREAAPDDAEIEVWFQDEARAGQKGMMSRIRARTGTRPRIVRDHRYGYGYLFAATRSDDPAAVGHVCPRANTEEMNRHLDDVAQRVSPGKHAVVVLDGAGWHRSKALRVPDNLTLLRLPPYSPELNPVEQVFAYLKANFLSNRVFPTVEAVHQALGDAWRKFVADPDRIASITARAWAKVAQGRTQ